MNTNLLEFVLVRLSLREPPWTKVAEASGVPYNTLKKIATGVTPNPGVKHIQALASYFTGVEAARNCTHPATPKQAAVVEDCAKAGEAVEAAGQGV